MLALSYVAAKSTNDAIGIDQSDENAGGAQLLAETVTDQPHTTNEQGLLQGLLQGFTPVMVYRAIKRLVTWVHAL